jgi:hypothetical protein
MQIKIHCNKFPSLVPVLIEYFGCFFAKPPNPDALVFKFLHVNLSPYQYISYPTHRVISGGMSNKTLLNYVINYITI